MVASAGKPHSAALMTAKDCEDGYLQLVPENSEFRNYVAARFALDLLTYFPGKFTSKFNAQCYFVCVKQIALLQQNHLKTCSKTPQKEIKIYSEGHFDIYVNQGFEKVIHDQIDFLNRTVSAN